MDDPRYAIALRDTPGLSRSRAFDLLRRFGRPRFVFEQSLEDLRAILDDEPVARRLARRPDLRAAERELGAARDRALEVLAPGEDGFPPLLVAIDDPPLLLYCRGRLPEAVARAEGCALAIVGSRRPSARARDTARDWAAAVAANGAVVVSGLAYGIDAAAHEGALEGGGATVAVLASGADQPSPQGNVRLAHRILEQGGALLSEFPPGTPAFAGHFPERNRLISGLAPATLVVEARERSGSLLTASHARAQGRRLLVVPGPIDSAECRGSNALLREEGRPVTARDELLDDVFGLDRARTRTPAARAPDPGPEAARVLAILRDGPCGVDALGARIGLSAPELSALLVELELAGHVARSGSRVSRRDGRDRG